MTIDEFNHLITSDSLKLLKESRQLDPFQFRLKHQNNSQLPIRAISEQIDAYQRAEKKFPDFDLENVLFTKKGVEQATGKTAAIIHSGIIKGKSILDMTGGVGFDSLFLSKNANNVTTLEKEIVTFNILKYNCRNCPNINPIHTDAIDFLKSDTSYYDWIYVDPDRRSSGKREINFMDHQPDVFSHFDFILNKCDTFAIKLSPMTDISAIARFSEFVHEIIVISIDNECKELLVLCSSQSSDDVTIRAILGNSKSSSFSEYKSLFQSNVQCDYAKNIEGFLIEPDKGLIKANLIHDFSNKKKIVKLSPKSDYLISHHANIEGARRFEILAVLPNRPKKIKSLLKDFGIDKASISARNLPMKPDNLRATLKLKDGGNYHLHFTLDKDSRVMCIITKSIQR